MTKKQTAKQTVKQMAKQTAKQTEAKAVNKNKNRKAGCDAIVHLDKIEDRLSKFSRLYFTARDELEKVRDAVCDAMEQDEEEVIFLKKHYVESCSIELATTMTTIIKKLKKLGKEAKKKKEKVKAKAASSSSSCSSDSDSYYFDSD